MKGMQPTGLLLLLCLNSCGSVGDDPSARDLQRLLPEFANPRIMNLEDLPGEKDRIAFKDYGYSFSMRGDFNRDGAPDIAIAGRFDNLRNPNDVTFVAILTKRDGKWSLEYLLRPQSRIAMLIKFDHPDREKQKEGFQAIAAQYSGGPSDDYNAIYWNGRGYKSLSGYDLIANDVKNFENELRSK